MKNIGFNAYLTKPIRRSQLFDSLAMVLGNKKAAAEINEPSIITRHTVFEARRKNIRILLAEDNVVNRKLAMRLLTNYGFLADQVVNGEEAIKALASEAYDLVLMDVQMPNMDGIEATKIIRDPNSKVLNHKIPIIAMTAHAMKGDRELCLKAGMDDYVSKPVEPDLMFAAIERQLQKRPEEGDASSQSQTIT
jgi:CheY-like chemotaxis protein